MNNIVDVFMNMVKIDSESGNEKEFAFYVKNLFEKLGCEILLDEKSMEKTGSNGPSVVVKVKENKSSKNLIGLSAHLDTVVPGNGIKPIIDGEYIKSDGSTILGADDKSGIAAMYCAVKHLIDNNLPIRETVLVFTTGEEVGLLGAKHLDASLVKGVNKLVVFDSGTPFGTVITQAPSQNSLEFIIKGKAAHAGVEPEKGVNAIVAAAKGIAALELGRIDEETTCNFGIIKGGKATNIVPDNVKIEGEVRSRSDEKLNKVTENIVNTMERIVKENSCEIKSVVINEYKAYNLEDSHELVQEVIQAGKKIDVDIITGSTGGGSDTNIHNARGIDSVNFNTGMDKVHTNDERIKIKDLEKLQEFIIALLSE